MTEYTGYTGTLSAPEAVTGLAEFSVKVDVGVATHPRSGEASDLNLPGKLTVTGTIKRIQADATLVQAVMDRALVALTGSNGTDTVTITDAFYTGGTWKFTDAGEIMSDDMTYAVKDASAGNPLFA
jgi:hypothetical protein